MAPFTFFQFLKSQLTPLPKVELMDLTGRYIIVTGSNTGLGLEAARHFAALNATKVILAVRSLEKGEEARKDILASTKRAHDAVEVWQLDMASFASVKAFAKKAEALPRLDVANLNAGVVFTSWTTTKDGYETTLAVNCVNTGLLGVLLLPTLQKTALMPPPPGSLNVKPHLTLTGSEVHAWAKFPERAEAHPIHALNDEKRFVANDRYLVSKLIDLYLAREIAARAGPSVVVNVVNPGLCHSELVRNLNFLAGLFMKVYKALIARTTEQGSRTMVWACLHDTAPGAYSASCRVEEESDFSLSEAGKDAQARVWADLKAIYDKEAPETSGLTA